MEWFLFIFFSLILVLYIVSKIPKPYQHKMFCITCNHTGIPIGDIKENNASCEVCGYKKLVPPNSPVAIQFQKKSELTDLETVDQISKI